MKNITVLRVFVIMIFINLSVSFSYSQTLKERNSAISLGAYFGFVCGQAAEYVYSDGTTKGEFLSKLDWDMKPVFYLGLQLDFGRKDIMGAAGFFASLSFNAGIPGDSGFLEDRDWMSIENAKLTHFSKHTNRTGEFFRFDADIGASIPVKNYFYIKPFINAGWMRFSFAGRDGYGIYAKVISYDSNGNPVTFHDINDDPDYHSFNGNVILYEQNYLFLATGLAIGTKAFFPFAFELSFKISPLTFCAAIDNHINRNLIYRDYTFFGFYLEPELAISFSIKRVDMLLGISCRYIGKTRGFTFINNSPDIESNKSGAGLSLLDARFLIKINL